MLKSAHGVVDRVALSHLIPGLSYDVPEGVGRYLIALRCAEELSSSQPALIVPLDEAGVFEVMSGGIHVVKNEAADYPQRRRRRKDD